MDTSEKEENRRPEFSTPAGKKARDLACIVLPVFAEAHRALTFLRQGQSAIHHHQDGKHQQSQQSRPLQHEALHDQHEADVLRVAQTRVRASPRQLACTLSRIQHRPRFCQQPEAATYEHMEEDVEWAEMRIAPPCIKVCISGQSSKIA